MDIKTDLIKKTIFASTAIVLSLGLVTTASAHEGGYATDGSGRVLKDGMGRCVTAIHGNDFAQECGDIITAQPISKPAPVVVVPPPVKKVVVPKPKPKPEVVKPKPIVKVLSLNESGGANFGFDKDSLSTKAKGQLTVFAADVKSSNVNPSTVTVVGHTDSTGPEKYNQQLSERRANSVANYLSTQGIDRSVMQVSGRGESQPVASNKTKAGRAENRRVDIKVTGQRRITVQQ